ncbi:hypothetical protein NL676_018910 [Syzygium grande]|nr:hypothetical protein NL676_018910 [Syzygium grande]
MFVNASVIFSLKSEEVSRGAETTTNNHQIRPEASEFTCAASAPELNDRHFGRGLMLWLPLSSGNLRVHKLVHGD